VHNGRTTKFWSSSWLSSGAPAMMFPALFQHSRHKCRTLANAPGNENWIRDVMHDITPTLLLEYTMLWILIDATVFDSEDTEEDEIVWTRSASGEYSTKSAYEIQFDGSFISSFPMTIWQVWVPSRCKFFSWLMLHSRFWTAGRLLMREWRNDYFCLVCRRNLEMVSHLFQECLYVRQVWTKIGNWASISSFHPTTWTANKTMQDWFGELGGASSTNSKGARSLSILVCWMIWRERNARVFDRSENHSTYLVCEIKSEAMLWMPAGNKKLGTLVGVLVSE
jgi:hypothetical protein